jgi:hypothetical protein
MQRKMYRIQFMVEKNAGGDDDEGHDSNNDGNGEDNRMEEFEHDSAPDPKYSTPKDKAQDGGFPQQSSNHNGECEPSKKVATWASLFQDEEGCRRIEKLEIGDYSCIRLLREMEAPEHEDEEEV